MSDIHPLGTHGRLIYMANQIARNFCALGHEAAPAATADHIAQFWDPRMKSAVSGDEPELSDIAARAFAILRSHGNPAPQTMATVFSHATEGGGSDAG